MHLHCSGVPPLGKLKIWMLVTPYFHIKGKIRVGDSTFAVSVQDHYYRIYYEALDLIVNCITSRFQQPAYKVYCNLQNLLLKSVKKCDLQKSSNLLLFNGSDFNKEQLQLQLSILANALSSQVEHNFHSIPSSESSDVRRMCHFSYHLGYVSY